MTDRMTMNERCDALMNPKPRGGLCDSDRNILADLAGEADEPCALCNVPVRPHPVRGSFEVYDFEYKNEKGEPMCEECAYWPEELDDIRRKS